MVWVYKCKDCGKILGTSDGGKKGVSIVKVLGVCCYNIPEYIGKKKFKEIEGGLKK